MPAPTRLPLVRCHLHLGSLLADLLKHLISRGLSQPPTSGAVGAGAAAGAAGGGGEGSQAAAGGTEGKEEGAALLLALQVAQVS